MKSIMYHYVRPTMRAGPRLRFLHVADFRRQLDFFESRFRLPSLSEFIQVIEGGDELPKDVLILTFDDGLLDHYRHVFPELVNRGTFGIFYVATLPLQKSQALDVHKVHWLVGSVSAQELLSQIHELCTEEMTSPGAEDVFGSSMYANHDDPQNVTHVKRVLNYLVSPRWRTALLDELLRRNGISLIVDDLYLTPAHIREMHEAGMLIGSHSVSHPVMSQVPADGQQHEIQESFRFLDDLVGGLTLKTYCHPYGGDQSFGAVTEEILCREGCRLAFSVESRDIRRDDLSGRPQALPRYDCNEFAYGRAR